MVENVIPGQRKFTIENSLCLQILHRPFPTDKTASEPERLQFVATMPYAIDQRSDSDAAAQQVRRLSST